tara:strand:+ start:416 stop:685 length:270 start_codon:yes stop_codon:yes gene_type:complete
MESLTRWIESLLVGGLKPVLDPLHSMLDQLPPSIWRLLVCLFLLTGGLWTLFLSRESVYRGCGTSSRWADLRVWVCVLVVPYVLIYLLF